MNYLKCSDNFTADCKEAKLGKRYASLISFKKIQTLVSCQYDIRSTDDSLSQKLLCMYF